MGIQINGNTDIISAIDGSLTVSGATINSAGIITATGPINLTNNPFYQNNQTVSSNYTIPQSVNAMSAGPITISNGITVVISSGGYWKIV